MDTINNLIEGNITYRKEQFPSHKEELEKSIKYGQKPQALVITCCDSRITPFLITGCKPGDLFVVRNIGNFVPPYSHDDTFQSFYAVIEYALEVLEIKNIIVCGHTHCGACKSLHDDLSNKQKLPNVRKWLKLGLTAKQHVLKNKHLYTTQEELYRQTEKQSLICQLEHLKTYPIINEKLDSKQLNIHGWYYHLENGSIEYYDRENEEFKDITQYNHILD
jgi:carbonic anhydrase